MLLEDVKYVAARPFLIILLLQHLLQVSNAFTDIMCPHYCQCELLQSRNSADCSGKNLINSNLDLPESVQILNLAFNDISNVDNTCFKNFSYLRILNMSHNALSTIHPDAFSMLLRVRSIDLSFNRLEDVPEYLIETNRHLSDLTLEGNKFMLQSKRRLLRSSFLRSLNLRNSHLYFVDESMFIGLPRLEELNLSHNLLVTISISAFMILPNLRFLDITGNRWMCHDAKMMQELEYLRRQNTNITLRYCELILPEVDTNPLEDQQQAAAAKLMSAAILDNTIDDIGSTHIAQWQDLETIIQQEEPTSKGQISDDDDLSDDYSDYASLPYRCRIACGSGFYQLREACKYKLSKLHDLITRKFQQKRDKECEMKEANTNLQYNNLVIGLIFGSGCVAGIVFSLIIYCCATCINKQCTFKVRPQHDHSAVNRLPVHTQANIPMNNIQSTLVTGDPPRRQIRVRVNNCSVPADSNFVAGLFGKKTQYNIIPLYQKCDNPT